MFIEIAMVVNALHKKWLTRMTTDDIDRNVSILVQILLCLFTFTLLAWIKTPKETKGALLYLTIKLPKQIIMLPKRALIWIQTTSIRDGNRFLS